MRYSIIVPVYNAARFLSECLESISSQSFSDWECICVNDGSTDESLSILRTHAERDIRFVIVDKPNGGVSSARNAALEIAKGEYGVFVDSDDYLDKDFLLRCDGRICQCPDMDCVVFRPYQVGENREDLPVSRQEPESPPVVISGCVLDAVVRHASRWCLLSAWSKTFRVARIRELGLRFNEKLSLGEDALFWAEFFACSNCLLIDFSYSGYFYRQVSHSLSRSQDVNVHVRGVEAVRYGLLRGNAIQNEQLLRFVARKAVSLIALIRSSTFHGDKRQYVDLLVGVQDFKATILGAIARYSDVKFRLAAMFACLMPKWMIRRVLKKFVKVNPN